MSPRCKGKTESGKQAISYRAINCNCYPQKHVEGAQASYGNSRANSSRLCNCCRESIRGLLDLVGATFANSKEGGVEITVFLPNSPIQAAGLHVGDVIKAVDLKPVKTAEDFREAVAAREPGANVRISYVSLHSNQWWVQKEVNVSLPK